MKHQIHYSVGGETFSYVDDAIAHAKDLHEKHGLIYTVYKSVAVVGHAEPRPVPVAILREPRKPRTPKEGEAA